MFLLLYFPVSRKINGLYIMIITIAGTIDDRLISENFEQALFIG
jgi:hypothetical protein